METMRAVEVGIVILLICFVALNIAAAIVFLKAPHLLASPHELMRDKYIERFEGDLKPYVHQWFGLKDGDWNAFVAEYRRASTNNYTHEPFSEYKHPAREGRFLNISPHGFRYGENQGVWPPDEKYFNIFFMGGSTLLNVGPDWTTVSSYLQEILNGRDFGKEVRIYNFGRGAYFSSLEKTLLFKILTEGNTPNLAIFLHGANDAFFYHGLPATNAIFSKAIDDMNRELSAETRNKDRARPKWNLLGDFFSSLPLFRARVLLKRKWEATHSESSLAPLNEAQVDTVIDQWQRNRRQVEAVCEAFGFPAVFVWQPTPAYRYDLSYHKALPYFGSLHGHERAGPVYERLRSRLGDKWNAGNFIWLADIHEGLRDPIYLDSVHYTAGFNRIIAEKIAKELIDRQLLSKNLR